ncbi:GUN4 domain-containing protein [Tolypothrix sp. VBCCA 56010]|uniref:GUN4 domain-containing protein n=1 Tax=Tolypothrix sp. VBCCA 56010 TaxID=3137731 RepID=UPI003D7ECC5C
MPKDVFLCHNSKEKAEVEKIRAQLLQKGIDAWLDKYDFEPFRRWQDQLEEIIPQVKAVAVFIGSSGVGPWADIEMREFLVEFAKNHKLRIGLVILPGCPDKLINIVPRFLKGFHWVDFRLQNPDPMEQLIWGITGQKPKTQPITLSQPSQKPSDRRQFLKWVGWGSLGLVTSVVGGEIWSQRRNQPVVRNNQPIKAEPAQTATPETKPTNSIPPSKQQNEPTKTEPSQTTTPETKPTNSIPPREQQNESTKTEPSQTATPETKLTNSIPPREQQNEPNILKSEKGIDYSRLRDLLAAKNWKEADKETYRVMLQAVGKKDGDWFDWFHENELLNFPCTDLRTIEGLWVKYSNGHFGFSVQKEIYLSVGNKADGKYDEEAWLKFCDRVGWTVKSNSIDYSHINFDTASHRGHLPGDVIFSGPGWAFSRVNGLFSRIKTCKL